MMKVNICLSTYNGSAFLSEQIKSIQSQTFQDWTLLIRDDGSTDNTAEIIRAFEKSDSRIVFINSELQKNIGFVASFFELVHTSQADFYFFSDQDDVWLPNKLELMLDEAKKHEKSLPMLVYSNYKIVDESLNVKHEGMLRRPSTSLTDALTLNSVNGWTSMINHSLAKLWSSYDGIDFHDWYLAELAAATGQLIYLDKITGLYRQHEKNAVGTNTASAAESFSHRLSATWLLIENCWKRARKVLDSGGELISHENQKILKDFISLENQNILKRLLLTLKYRYLRVNLLASLKLRVLFITKLGYKNGNTNR